MNANEVVEYVDRHGYNPDLRDSGHAVALRTNRGLVYRGLGVHTLRGENGEVTSLLLIHNTGAMYFNPWEVEHVGWVLPAPEILAAIA